MKHGMPALRWLGKKALAALAVVVVLAVSSCAPADQGYDYGFFALDTYISMKIYGADNPEQLCKQVEDKTAELENLLSRHAAGSELAKINASPAGDYTISDELAAVVSASLAAAESSGGAYDPTITPLAELWNIGGGNESVPAQADIDAARAKTGYGNVKLNDNTLTKLADYAELDLGGSGKGYILEKAVDILKQSGGWGIVSFGGNIGVYGKKPSGDPWKIGIKNPRELDNVSGYVTIESGFVSVSGDYERYFIADGKRYCHIIDPATGWPVDNGMMSVAVWSENALEGDITSTALFVMGVQRGLQYCEQNGIAALFVTADGISCSAAMDRLFTPAD